MKMKRREFLVRSVAGVGGILIGSQIAAAGEKKSETFDPYEIVPLGKTKLKVSRVGFGTGFHGGNGSSNQTRLGKEEFEALIKAVYERGVRFFDSADEYGSLPFIGPALKNVPRESYVVSTKIAFWSGKPEINPLIERFRKELDSDYIDLVLLHCMMPGDWNKQYRKQMDELDALKQKGVIRAHGISCHSIPALQAAVRESWVDSLHARINAYGTEMDDEPDIVTPLLKKLHEAGKGVVGMKLIGNGEFSDDPEMIDNSIKYVISQQCVDTMIVGFEKVEELDDFAARVRKVPKDIPVQKANG